MYDLTSTGEFWLLGHHLNIKFMRLQLLFLCYAIFTSICDKIFHNIPQHIDTPNPGFSDVGYRRPHDVKVGLMNATFST